MYKISFATEKLVRKVKENMKIIYRIYELIVILSFSFVPVVYFRSNAEDYRCTKLLNKL